MRFVLPGSQNRIIYVMEQKQHSSRPVKKAFFSLLVPKGIAKDKPVLPKAPNFHKNLYLLNFKTVVSLEGFGSYYHFGF